MELAAVILNYNDSEHTEEQVKRIRNYEILKYIVIVDNHSTDDSFARLSMLRSDKVKLIWARDNGGYGAGNNLGLSFAFDKLHVSHCVIANPDTCFSEACLRAMLETFRKSPDIGVVSAVMRDYQRGLQQTAWPIRPWLGELLNSGPISRRDIAGLINYRPSYMSGRHAAAVGAVHGSMLMIQDEAYEKSGGYDEQVFLYCEENILGWRLRNAGFHSVLLLDQNYLHENSGTISKTYHSMVPKQKLRQQSEMYYYKQYLQIAPWEEAITRVFHKIVLLETMAAERIRLL